MPHEITVQHEITVPHENDSATRVVSDALSDRTLQIILNCVKQF